ncbi:MAG: TIGR04086 family membrane protein [Lachnospiraceae bacterium]|nr:TIGR04086 family membrane protein [Lachnospiraceae bacterium]
MQKRILFILLKTTIATIVTTFVCLLVLTLALYKFNLQEKFMEAGIMITYFLSNFIGGFLLGKVQEKRRFAWGALLGLIYFIILIFLSVIVNGPAAISLSSSVVAFVVCVISGSIGGMVS